MGASHSSHADEPYRARSRHSLSTSSPYPSSTPASTPSTIFAKHISYTHSHAYSHSQPCFAPQATTSTSTSTCTSSRASSSHGNYSPPTYNSYLDYAPPSTPYSTSPSQNTFQPPTSPLTHPRRQIPTSPLMESTSMRIGYPYYDELKAEEAKSKGRRRRILRGSLGSAF